VSTGRQATLLQYPAPRSTEQCLLRLALSGRWWSTSQQGTCSKTTAVRTGSALTHSREQRHIATHSLSFGTRFHR
jgi:hypothetical protein